MSNKPLTAVDWLLQQFDEEKTPRQWEEVYKKAKELEKQQIIDAHTEGEITIIKKLKEIYPNADYTETDEEIRKFREESDADEESKQYYKDTYGND